LYLFIFHIQRALFNSKLNLKFKKGTTDVLHLAYGAETWTEIRNTWKVLKCGAGEG